MSRTNDFVTLYTVEGQPVTVLLQGNEYRLAVTDERVYVIEKLLRYLCTLATLVVTRYLGFPPNVEMP